MYKTIDLYFWKVNYWIEKVDRVKVWLFWIDSQKDRFSNLIRGEVYRCSRGHTFKVHKYTPYYTRAYYLKNGMYTQVYCKCGLEAHQPWDNIQSIDAKNYEFIGPLAREGVKIFEKGKRNFMYSKRAVKEYEKRHNLVFGSDDLEQESDHHKAQAEKELINKVTDRVYSEWVDKQKYANRSRKR